MTLVVVAPHSGHHRDLILNDSRPPRYPTAVALTTTATSIAIASLRVLLRLVNTVHPVAVRPVPIPLPERRGRARSNADSAFCGRDHDRRGQPQV